MVFIQIITRIAKENGFYPNLRKMITKNKIVDNTVALTKLRSPFTITKIFSCTNILQGFTQDNKEQINKDFTVLIWSFLRPYIKLIPTEINKSFNTFLNQLLLNK